MNFDPALFRPLTPPSDEGGRRRKPAIHITDTPGGPRVVADTTQQAGLSAAERRFMAEYTRLERLADGFGAAWGEADLQPGLPLHDNPYLLSLLAECTLVEVPSGAEMKKGAPARLTLELESQRVDKVDKGESKDKARDARIHVRLNALPEDDEDEPVSDFIILGQDWILTGDVLRRIQPLGENFARVPQLVQDIERSQLEQYCSLFLTFVDNVSLSFDGRKAHYHKTPEAAVPTLILEKVAPDQALYLRVANTVPSLGEDFTSDIPLTRAVADDGSGLLSVRNVERGDLTPSVERLEDLFSKSAPSRQDRKEIYNEGNFFIIPAETAGPFLINHLAEVLMDFRLVGSEMLKAYRVTAAQPRLNVRLSSGVDFLEGDAEVSIGEETFSISDLLKQYARNKYISLTDGNRAIIDEKYINRLQRLFNRRDKAGHIKVTFFDLPEIEALVNEKIKSPAVAKSRRVFEGFNTLASKRTPKYPVDATLRSYQKEGAKWIQYLQTNKLGGCLADDMGLGKTLQTICVLSVTPGRPGEPSLIVMPRSLLFNWEAELAKFAPQLRVKTYYGSDRNLDEALRDSDVVLTTYAMVRNDIDTLRRHRFTYVVLDESQAIKNVSSQTSRAVTLLDAEYRLALSGTPMENNLTEIYSLFRFLNPPMFGTLDEFNASYTFPVQRGGDKDALESLRRKIYPFILRRLKKDVLSELPERIDRTLHVEMSEEQQRLYEERRLSYRQEIKEAIARGGVAKSQFVMFQALNELRRIASVPESVTDGRVKSPKVEELVENLSDAVASGHKAVVFFNFVAGIEIVGERLARLGIQFETMTGSTSASARKRIVSQFQTDPDCQVLLMTLKVGGVGLNLTAADTVYIFEPWWNKAAEEQAVNRLHRMGQKKSVLASSLITEGTIEEKILQLQATKSELIDALISEDGAASKRLTEEDIDFILS